MKIFNWTILICISVVLFSSCQHQNSPHQIEGTTQYEDFLQKYSCDSKEEVLTLLNEGSFLDFVLKSRGEIIEEVYLNPVTGESGKLEKSDPKYKIKADLFKPIPVYEIVLDGPMKIKTYEAYKKQIIQFELDLSKFNSSNLIISEADKHGQVKEFLMNAFTCLNTNQLYTLEDSYFIFEGFAYRSGKREEVYIANVEAEFCETSTLHYLDVEFKATNGNEISLKYDDLANRNFKGELENTFGFELIFQLE